LEVPPFSATRDGGDVYSRGTVDDKDNLTATLMRMLDLKRLKVPLDRDVIPRWTSTLRRGIPDRGSPTQARPGSLQRGRSEREEAL